MTHYAVIVSSGRFVPVIRRGRLLMVIHGNCRGMAGAEGWVSISTYVYNERFHLMPKGWAPHE